MQENINIFRVEAKSRSSSARRRQHRPRNFPVLCTSFFSVPSPRCRRRESGDELTGALLKKPTVLAAIAFVALAQA